MSSLLQHGGPIANGRVGLVMCHVVPSERWPDSETLGTEDELVPCSHCGKSHAQLYVVWRRPIGMFGCWVVFRYNGAEHVPDLSVPISVFRLPRGAVKMSPEDSAKYWHSTR